MGLAVCGFVPTAFVVDFSDDLLCVFSLTEGVMTMVSNLWQTKRAEQWSKPLLVDDYRGLHYPILFNIFWDLYRLWGI